jgi:hypothetical protein
MTVRSKHMKAVGVTSAALLTIGALSSPAAAVSKNFDYNCPAFGAAGPGEDSVNADLNPGSFPATMVAGQTVTNAGASMSVNLDQAQTFFAQSVGTSVSGKVVATGAGNSFPFTMTIPTTPIPQTVGATMQVPASGPAKIRPLKAGTWTVKAGPMTANLTVSGGAGGTQSLAVACTAPTDGSATYGTIKVSKDKTTTAATAGYNAKKDVAKGKAKVRSHFGLRATGKVVFILKKGTKRIAKASDTLNKKGIATHAFKHVKKHGKYSITAKYVGNSNLKGSSGKDTFRVR